MSYRFHIVAGSMEILDSFLKNDFRGVSISHEPASTSKPRPARTMAYDSAEDILQFIVTAAHDVDIGLFSAWLYEMATKPSRKKTTINGQQIPTDQAELAALIVALIVEQKNQAEQGQMGGNADE